MSDWKSPSEGRGPDRTKLGLAVGAAAGLLVLGWILTARSGEEKVSSGGFSFGGSAPISARPAGAALTERRSQTGLSFVRLGDANAPSSSVPAAPASAASSAASADASGPADAAPPAAAPAFAPAAPAAEDKAAAAALGARTDAAGLARQGAESGLLSGLIVKALDHPAALRYLLNNKTLVDAYFARDGVRQNCSSGASLKSLLTDPSSASDVSSVLTITRDLLSHPDAAAAAAGSEFGARVANCPSVGQLAKDPSAVMQIAAANPAALGLVGDPGAMKALASNPQALSALGGVQSSLAGGAPPSGN